MPDYLETLRGQKQKQDRACSCEKCSNEWMEAVRVGKFDSTQPCTLTQSPAVIVDFSMLRCLKCGHLQSPPMYFNPSVSANQEYVDLIKTLNPDADKFVPAGTEDKAEEETKTVEKEK